METNHSGKITGVANSINDRFQLTGVSSAPERGAAIIIKVILVRGKLCPGMDPFYFIHKRRYVVISATVINTELEHRSAWIRLDGGSCAGLSLAAPCKSNPGDEKSAVLRLR